MSYPIDDPEVVAHSEAIADLPDTTRKVVLDALRVRAMDFVGDRVGVDEQGDLAADICRNFNWGGGRVRDADEAEIFDPELY